MNITEPPIFLIFIFNFNNLNNYCALAYMLL